jgi:hypothetical protein
LPHDGNCDFLTGAAAEKRTARKARGGGFRASIDGGVNGNLVSHNCLLLPQKIALLGTEISIG